MKTGSLRNILIPATVLGFLLLPLDVAAQRPTLEGAAGSGTGASFGKGDGSTVVLMTPVFLDIDIIVGNDERPQLEYVVGFQAELQGRVSAGIVPQIRLNTGPDLWVIYGLLGAPFVFAPFRLFGVEAGPGVLWQVTPSFGLFFEVTLDIFFLGNDLPDKSVVVQLDGLLGVRLSFI